MSSSWVVVVVVKGRDVRGERSWSHCIREGPNVTIASNGIHFEAGCVVCPLGSIIDGWNDCIITVNDHRASLSHIIRDDSPLWQDGYYTRPNRPHGVFCVLNVPTLTPPPPTPSSSSLVASSVSVSSSLISQQRPFPLRSPPSWPMATLNSTCVTIDPLQQHGIAIISCICWEGSEGSPITQPNGSLWGMLVCPMWAENSPTGLSVAVEMSRVLGKKKQQQQKQHELEHASVVVVSANGGKWGCGVRVGQGKVLTAAHVAGEEGSLMRVGKSTGRVQRTWLDGWMDVAIITEKESIVEKKSAVAQLKTQPLKGGDKVALWGALPSRDKAVIWGQVGVWTPGMMLVEVDSWGGCSGGALVDESGSVVGILVATASKEGKRQMRSALVLPTCVWIGALTGEALPSKEDITKWWIQPPPMPPVAPKFMSFKSKL